MHDDEPLDQDLRARFRALAAEEQAAAPDLSSAQINAWRSALLVNQRRTWRLGTVVGVAAGAVVMLTIGLVLGASTGYASAEVIIKERGDTPLPPAPALAVLKNIPPLMFSCGDAPRARAAALPPAQQGVPIVDLPAPSAKTTVSQGAVLGIRQVSNGNILVNDAGRRQMKLFDSTLTLLSVVRDSVPGSATSYGPRRLPMMPYLGDSSLLGDYQGGTVLVMGPTGQIAHAMAALDQFMLVSMTLGWATTDDKGRILFNAQPRGDLSLGLGRAKIPDSTMVIRADLDARRTDTLARLKSTGTTQLLGREGNGPVRFSVEPIPLTDDWALLSDGSIAVVRGRDYHVDWILPDGTTRSTPKLPFDWKRITDEEKQKLIDSVRDVVGPSLGRAMGQRRVGPPPDGDTRAGARSGGAGVVEQGPPMPTEFIAPDLKDMFDFHPPIRHGAVKADLDGNVWILPTTSAQSKNGELVYDVLNAKGDFYRVRVPFGRSLAGFGKGGVVFLLSGDKDNGFYLEKTKLPPRR